MRIAFQGVEGAYSQQAIREYFTLRNQEKYTVVAKKTFQSVFSAVQSGSVDFGMVPIENSLAGSIHQNYDLLRTHRVWIAGEHKLRIKHQLIGSPTSKLSNIKKVLSHPQALSQCSEFLKKMKYVEIIPHFDTAGAVKDLCQKPCENTAAIAGIEAAQIYQMKILRTSIENHETNYTRFFLLVKNDKNQPRQEAQQKWKTSVVFALKSIPGGLHKCLSIFAIRDIDLLKIESRPLAGSPWRYLFYLDFAASIKEERGRKSLEHLAEIAENIKILGSYPVFQKSNKLPGQPS